MSPRARSLVSSLVIVLALAATWIAWRLEPPPPPPPSTGLQAVFDFPPSAVRAIDVDSWQGRLRARLGPDGWQVEEVRLGKGAPANDGTALAPSPVEVDQTIGALVREVVTTPQIDRFDAAGMPLHDFGLDRPQARITLTLESGETSTLEIGELTITTSALYARVLPSEDVFQIGSLVFNNLAATLYRLRALDAGAAEA